MATFWLAHHSLMFTNFINPFIAALNSVQSQVWHIVQFIALLGLVAYGGHLIQSGHNEAGISLVSGAFALLKFEVGGNTNAPST